jgi:hypothetical protein
MIDTIFSRFRVTLDRARIGDHSELRVITALSVNCTLTITAVLAKPFPSCCVFTGRFLATASKSGDT